ncbi:MAG: thioredoxin family protein [Patescibacteria group bacterium]|nr:thioredoxin family protein [Patescibacteria group bacterium]
MSKKLFLIIIFAAFFILPRAAQAKEAIEIFYFLNTDCQPCQGMTDALNVLDAKYPELTIAKVDVSSDEHKQAVFQDFMAIYRQASLSVPTVIIGSKVFTGYDVNVVAGIEEEILYCQSNICPSPQTLLDDYLNQLGQEDQATSQTNSLLFWSIFLIVWPILGAGAIIYVLKKYKKQ